MKRQPVLTWSWATSSGECPRGVALVVHGLNLQPRRMQAIVDQLTLAGIDALTLSLHGHGDNYYDDSDRDSTAAVCAENDFMYDKHFPFLPRFYALHSERIDARLRSFQRVTYPLWRDEIDAAYRIARQRSVQFDCPLILVAYSLGALLGVLLLTTGTPKQHEPVDFAGMILFSPALAIRGWDHLLKPLARYPRWIIPSLAPTAYRSNPGTPMAGYSALFAAHDHFLRADKARLNIPTLVFADPQDELISYAGVVRLMKRKSLSDWDLFTVRKRIEQEVGHDPVVARYHHLLIDADAVGAATWARMTERMQAHFYRLTGGYNG